MARFGNNIKTLHPWQQLLECFHTWTFSPVKSDSGSIWAPLSCSVVWRQHIFLKVHSAFCWFSFACYIAPIIITAMSKCQGRTFFLYLHSYSCPWHIWPIAGVKPLTWFVVMHFVSHVFFSVWKETQLKGDKLQVYKLISWFEPEQTNYRCKPPLLSVHHVPHGLELLPLLQLHELLKTFQLLWLGARHRRHQLLLHLLPQFERHLGRQISDSCQVRQQSTHSKQVTSRERKQNWIEFCQIS